MIDLSDRLVRLFNRVHKRQAYVKTIRLKLGKNGLAEGFCRDSRTVGNKKHSSVGHDILKIRESISFQPFDKNGLYCRFGSQPTIMAI